ncbi:iron complex transport system permease protein [Anoxynatronum buryatiense]|uniref:Iron complex transport system permease protein n=2 Tax=Anoxynatronum buryatiense TaxID=489973 RepID=A0AA45WX35_9CLOT|nr:iron complex transport system permease protein [Anoxynatronum buryatiense]
MAMEKKSRARWVLPGLGVLLIFLMLAAAGVGRYMVPFDKVVSILSSVIFNVEQHWTDVEQTVVLNIRMPRIILAILIGAGLSVSGVALQALFANPLVSSHVLGVSYGAGFGAAIGILLSENHLFIQGMAIVFGMVAIALTYSISKTGKGTQLYMLVLAGVIVGALFQALISLIQYVADPEEKLPSIVYWLMGSLGGTSLKDLRLGIPLIGVGILIIFAIRWHLNVLSLPEEEARSMGVNLKLLRGLIIIATTVITAVAVSLSGIIGFVGLVIPHFARMVVGHEHRVLVPVTILMGGIYLLLIDTIARSATAAEIPLSILTAIVGAPFFAVLLRRTGGGWHD